MRFDGYDTQGFYDETFHDGGLGPRPGSTLLVQRIEALNGGELLRRQKAAESALLNLGITFNVYGNDEGQERIFPFDIVPRIVEPEDWRRIDRGLKQRIRALNLFLDDVYHDAKIVQDGVVPEEVLSSGKSLLPQCEDLDPPRGIWCHVTGTDIVRDAGGELYVLEDNMRCPSGVSIS